MMPYDNSNDTLTHDSPAARRISTVLVWIAGLALVGNCLLTSPAGFSSAHKNDDSLLRTIVSALALAGPEAERSEFPTARGVEIRNLIYYMAAALLTIAGGLRLLTTTARPRLTADDAWNFRARAWSPVFWWIVLLAISAITSFLSSHAPDVSFGGVVIRYMQAAWWWPIALLLLPIHARRLTLWLVVAVSACTALGLWYYTVRTEPGWLSMLAAFRLPDQRLVYPIGNSLWFGACILPAVFAAIGLAMDSLSRPSRAAGGAAVRPNRLVGAFAVVAFAVTLLGLLLSQSRSSAWVGFAAGIAFMAMIISKRSVRPAVALVALVIALVGVWKIQSLRESGASGERAHSIRTRLNHEWPYAIALFKDKPVGGNGEGGYAMRASGIAREDQLDEPSTRAMGERWWFIQAHNEFLELLADLGIVGAAAFVFALLLTLLYAMRYCDRARTAPEERPHRWLVVGLSAALFGMMLEECSSVAMREPGFPPIFLTIWAVLWAIIRVERRQTEPVQTTSATESNTESGDGAVSAESSPRDQRLGSGVFRGLGLAAVVIGLALGYYGYRDWLGIQASYQSQIAHEEGRYEEAIQKADAAGEQILEPFLKLTARMFAVKSRTAAFAKAVASEPRPSDATLSQAAGALNALGALEKAAPRFLSVSRLASEVFGILVRAAQARGDTQQAAYYFQEYQAALAASFKDDPFNTAIALRMWQDIPQAAPRERMIWLRCLLRRGEMDESTRAMAEDLFRRVPGAFAALNEQGRVAEADYLVPVDQWTDRLSPETFRLAALLKDLTGDAAGAVTLARRADEMYARAGPRLFAAHSAAIREMVIYRLHDEPTSQTDELLDELVRAHVLIVGPLPPDVKDPRQEALPLELGQTRALVLAAAGREDATGAQLTALAAANPSAPAASLADVYAALADQFAPKPQFADLAMKWARRALELNSAMPLPHYSMLGLHLAQEDVDGALVAARAFIKLMPDRDRAMSMLQQKEMRRPDSAVWNRLREEFPDYPELPMESPAATQPAGPRPPLDPELSETGKKSGESATSSPAVSED